ncbi:MAG: PspC domain-containing protein [Bacteroidaceae bacterium]|nr:PspC domain-containing protein [Bacteroidaceae bacterium]
MKKSFSVNMGGAIFCFDEDALEMMERYIACVKEYYKGKGEELKVAEVENNIAAKLSARVGTSGIVTVELVKVVLDETGLPFGAIDNSSAAKPENKTNETKNNDTDNDAPWRAAMLLGNKLFRDSYGQYLGGVLSGLAKYCGWGVGVTRAITVVLFIIGLAGGALAFLVAVSYVVMWVAIPSARSVVDVTRMRKPQPLGYNTQELEAAWKRNYEIALAELTYPKNNGCLSALVKIIFFSFLFIVGVPLLFALAILLFVLVMVVFTIIATLGTAVFENIYVVILLLLPLFALVHWILKKSGVCKPLNGYVKSAIIICWLVTLVLACYKINRFVEDRGGWDKLHSKMVQGSVFSEDFWKDIVEEVIENSEIIRYAQWADENKNLPFIIDLKQYSAIDKVYIRFFDRKDWVGSSGAAFANKYDVTKLEISLSEDEEGVVRFVWDNKANEILVSLKDATLGASMRLDSQDFNIRYISENDSVNYANAMEKGCVPFEIRYNNHKMPEMYIFGNDTIDGVVVRPISTRSKVSNNGKIMINGFSISGSEEHTSGDYPGDEQDADSVDIHR